MDKLVDNYVKSRMAIIPLGDDKSGGGKGWNNKPVSELIKEFKINPSENVAIRMGKNDLNKKYYAGIDFDIYSANGKCDLTQKHYDDYVASVSTEEGMYNSATQGNTNILLDYTDSEVLKNYFDSFNGKNKIQLDGMEILFGSGVRLCVPPCSTPCKITGMKRKREFKTDKTIYKVKWNNDLVTKFIIDKIPPQQPKPKPKPKQKKSKNYERVEFLIDLISLKYIDDYNHWIKIVWAIKNCGLDESLALKMSKKSEKFDVDSFDKIWENEHYGNTVVGIGTIHYYAKLSNPNSYRQTIDIYGQNEMKSCSNDAQRADIVIRKCGDDILLVEDILYIYHNNEWCADKKGSLLRCLVHETLNNMCNEQHKYWSNLLPPDVEVETDLQTDFEQIKVEINEKLKNIAAATLAIGVETKINSIYKVIRDKIARRQDKVVFNNNKEQTFNVHFKNGVYEMHNKRFRSRRKDDYTTKYLDWDFSGNYCQIAYAEVESFFKKLQPETDQRIYLANCMAYRLTADTTRQDFNMNIGAKASNGKSTALSIHNNVFPIYTIKLHRDLFNKGYNKRHKYYNQIINEPIRCAYIEELDEGTLDVEELKDFVDGRRLRVEIMYGTSEEKPHGCKLTTASNHAFTLKTDKGILRRGVAQHFTSEFKPDAKVDDFKNHIYVLDRDYEKLYDQQEYKNAYFHYLLNHYVVGFKTPDKNKELFKITAEESDPILSIINDNFVYCKYSMLHKDDVEPVFGKTFTQRQITKALKDFGIIYQKAHKIDGKRGRYLNIKKLDDVESDCESELSQT